MTLASTYGLQRRSDTFAHVPRRTRNLADRSRSRVEEYLTDKTFDPQPYRARSYLQAYPRTTGWPCCHQLDTEIMSTLQYDVEP